MIVFSQKGNFKKTEKFLKKASKADYFRQIEKYAREGVKALSAATPVNTGKTAESWDYEIRKTKDSINIYFTNSNINNRIPIAIILQYGHGTNNGGYVQGIDYINPAVRPIFEKLAEETWKEVMSS